MEATATEAPAAVQKPAAQPTMGGSVYVKPQDIAWEPTQFERISIKVLYEDKPKGEMTCLLKWEPGATLPMHKHPEIEQTLQSLSDMEIRDLMYLEASAAAGNFTHAAKALGIT